MTRSLLLSLLAAALLAAVVAGAAAVPSAPAPATGPRTEVVVALASPPLAYAPDAAPRIDAEQRRFVAALHWKVPSADVRWRYRIVANGLAVVVPESAIPRLRSLPGVRDMFSGGVYHASLDRSPGRIGAPTLWGPGLDSAGQGIKIGIIDDGIDQTHRFFNPAGYTLPAGYPKGQRMYTTAKVIVARAFAPPTPTWRHARKPFDPELSGHATHVAGIAAGNRNTAAVGGRRVSGVAPRAYLGNYKALTIPTDAGVGLDGNAPEIVAAIEAAVRDGMDVINLSIGEPEIEPSRDVVALALDAAAAAGVVPVVAAGNDFGDFGRGSVASPGSSERAITVAAGTVGPDPIVMAGFSSAGPTPVSLRAKPDITAPGVRIVSSVPGGWGTLSGTSMATPHVAGGAALLRQRHPSWTAEQIKAALVAGAQPVAGPGGRSPARAGAGFVDLVAADRPLIAATPTSVSLGLVGSATSQTATVSVADLGGGAGTWTVAVVTAEGPVGTTVSAPASLEVPGSLALVATSGTTNGEASGVVTLTKDGVMRRIPYWFRVAVPALTAAQVTAVPGPGTYRGNTRNRQALVSSYRYPAIPSGGAVSSALDGPEQIFRLTLTRRVANFGVVITSRARGADVEPRVTVAGDENRLTGYPALPLNLNPYLVDFLEPTLAAGALEPLPGAYDIVFDSATVGGAGDFTFRLWVDDVTPPTARLVTRSVKRGQALRVRLGDAGSGVDASSVRVRVDGRIRLRMLRGGVLRISTAGLSRGRHNLRVQVSDYQETRNMEQVVRILPNTRVLTARVTVR